MKKSFQILDGSTLKILAMIFMVIDHIAAYLISKDYFLYVPMRFIGRLSFPIFAFLIVEGVRYSRKPIKYLGQLLILGIIMDIFTFIFLKEYYGNVLTTFFISGVTILLLEKAKNYYKLLAIIPFIIGLLTGFSFFPLRMQYGPFGMITVLLFYCGFKLTQKIINIFTNNTEKYNEYFNFTLYYVLIGSLLNVCFSTICSVFSSELTSLLSANDVDFYFQSYGALSTLILIFYSGKRGINNKYFKWSCYAFFPLHFAIIYLIGLLF